MTGALLVTGASGFVGGGILRRALAQGWPCVTLGRRAMDIAGVRHVVGDITDAERLDEAMRGVRVVVHAAGLAHQRGRVSGAAFTRTNVDGTRAVVEAAERSGVQHVVVVSSVAVYGRNTGTTAAPAPPDESWPLRPASAYAVSKRDAEDAARAGASRAGFALTLLRPATIVGPGDPGSVAALGRLLLRRRGVWVGDGAARTTLIDVDDFAGACLACAEADAAGTAIYNVGGWPVTKRQMVRTLADALAVPAPRLTIPTPVARGILAALVPLAGLPAAAGLRDGLTAWLADDVYDDTRWRARHGAAARTPWAESLRREARWLRQEAR